MIFDGRAAKKIYTDHFNGDDCTDSLVRQCQPLVEAIATDLSSSGRYREDLIQEGYVKLLKLLNSRKFVPNGRETGGDFHSWLSFALRNCMIDYLRKQKDHEDLPDDIPYKFTLDVSNLTALQSWAVARFPSLPPELTSDAAIYIHYALREDVHRKYLGTIITLGTVYDLDPPTAKLLYHSCRIFIQSGDANSSDALLLASHENYANTLIPELVLLIGKTVASEIILSFRSCKLQF